MPLVAAAVCPHPPVLVPEIAGAAAAELDDLRSACDTTVARLAASGAQRLLVLGADARTRDYGAPVRGSFAAWGVPLQVRLGHSDDGSEGEKLPLSLLVGAWLLTRVPAAATAAVRMATVDRASAPVDCAAMGRRIGFAEPWALLVMGDGSACRGLKAPGYDDPRALAYDTAVARALDTADTDALLALDPELSGQLRVAGRAPWQVLAGAVRATGRAWRGELRYDAAPYGVAYLVAGWEPA